jgi:hypothetical protein
MMHTKLEVDMDAIKIGPGGQTLGELKAAVLDTRAVFLSALLGQSNLEAANEAYDVAVRLLRAAYTRMGLPYVAPV